MQGHQPYPATPISDADFLVKRGKKRGNYSCGRCGFRKKGHTCSFSNNNEDIGSPAWTPGGDSSTTSAVTSASVVASADLDDTSPLSVVRPMHPPRRRRALSFDDVSVAGSPDELETEWVDPTVDLDLGGSGTLPMTCMWEVLRRLPPVGLLSAGKVCRGWRETARRLWRVAEELRLRVPVKAKIEFVGSVLQKCPGLVKLTLRMERSELWRLIIRSRILWMDLI